MLLAVILIQPYERSKNRILRWLQNLHFLYIAKRFEKVKNVINSIIFAIMLIQPYEEKEKLSEMPIFCADIIFLRGKKRLFFNVFQQYANAPLWGEDDDRRNP